ncbi:GNAT family N-acetyltransferase [Oceaniserpentilla sp. 4NH20-0058]|uniref:GNAT family N-acetyltransferase n=1 Tax=Oceaniserpentilla sp. 4NH20-0058 TaxID=3127660 RepID=UPI003105CADF
MAVEVELLDYHNPKHASELVDLMNQYALDPMGGAQPLSDFVTQNLASALSKREDAFSLIAYIDNKAVGLVNCMEGFSTFSCKPLVNIHDLVVDKHYRGQGVGQRLLAKVEELAREKGCCKLTLEVLSGNHVAKAVYEKHGFSDYALDPEKGSALFWQKNL